MTGQERHPVHAVGIFALGVALCSLHAHESRWKLQGLPGMLKGPQQCLEHRGILDATKGVADDVPMEFLSYL